MSPSTVGAVVRGASGFGRLRLAQAAAEKDVQEQRRFRRDAEDSFRKSIELDPARPAPVLLPLS